MKFKELKTDQELEIYRHTIHHKIDVLFPIEYLKQGRVYGYFNKAGQIIGGVAIILKGPFRVLNSIPDFQEFNIDPSLKDTAEITGLWLSSEKRSRFTSLMFWVNVIEEPT